MKLFTKLLIIATITMFLADCGSSDKKAEHKDGHKTEVKKSEIMADFTLENIDGEKVSLYETLKKGPVIIDFWATWCGPCCEELPHLNKIHEKYDNVTVFAVDTDGARTSEKGKEFVRKNGFTFQTLIDVGGRGLKKDLKISAIPVTYIVLPGGEIFYKHTGYKTGDEVELEEKLKEALASLKK